MFRLKLLLIGVGGFLAFMGYQEFRVSHGASMEPVKVQLSTLESGESLTNNHVLIGDHVAVYGGSVYEYSQGKYDKSAPGPNTKVTHAFYPIISEEHVFFDKLNTLAETHGSLDTIPDSEWPSIDDFKVLIKTQRFKTIGSIPDGMTSESSLQGMLVNSISGLDSEEEDLVRSSFPKTDLSNVLIIEDGRKPASLLKSLGMLTGGIAVALAGVATFFMGGQD